jgi:UDP-N-acetylmuramoylalanine--D-glutamate ligase
MTMQRTAIIGLGVTGYSCVKYLHGRDRLLVLDTRMQPPLLEKLQAEFPDVEVVCGARQFDPSGFDRVMVSPGVSLDSCLLKDAIGRVRFDSDIDLFCEAAEAPIIAVTGTNGKSTVTDLTGHLLNAAGTHTPTGGNLGEAALDMLDRDAAAYVLELSSFQLERMRDHHFLAATILNVSEDHIDRHGDMAAYQQSKQRIYRDCGLALANRDDPQSFPDRTIPQLVTFGADAPEDGNWGIVEREGRRYLACGDRLVCPCDRLRIAGRHNEQNALAACALAEAAGLEDAELAAGLAGYQGLAHRCQRLATVGGVDYINDSKATNVGATLAALKGFGDTSRRRLLLIAGGDGKGADFSPLRDPVGRYVRELAVFGQDAEKITAVVGDVTNTVQVADMASAVAHLHARAREGDVILLSPACASLDMYTSFAARGEDFGRCVQQVVQ